MNKIKDFIIYIIYQINHAKSFDSSLRGWMLGRSFLYNIDDKQQEYYVRLWVDDK